MIEIVSISGKGIPVLGNYTLPLNRHPLIVVRGKNLDKKQTLKNRSNGSGKTLSVSAIPAVAYNTTPKSLKKRGSKDILKVKQSSLSLHINNGSHCYITQTLQGSSIKYCLKQGLTAKNYRESKEAQLALKRLFPITEDQFFSQVFIDGRERTILQRGTATQRFAYIESVFNLNDYDKLNKLIAQDYTRIRTFKQELDVLIAEKQTRRQDLPQINRIKIRQKQQQLELDIGRLSERIDAGIDIVNNAKVFLKMTADVDLLDEKQLLLQLIEAEKEKTDLEALRLKSIRYYEREATYKQVIKRRKNINDQLQDLSGDTTKIPVVRKRIAELERELEGAQVALQDSLERIEERKKILEKRSRLDTDYLLADYKSLTVDEVCDKLTRVKNKIYDLGETLTHLINFSDPSVTAESCPVCRRVLDKSSAKIIKADTEKRQKNLLKFKLKLETTLKYLEITQQLHAYKKFSASDIEQLQTIVVDIKKTIVIKKNRLKTLEQRLRLEDQLEALPDVNFKEQQQVPRPEIYEDTLRDLARRIQRLEYSIKTVKQLKELQLNFSSRQEAQTALEKQTQRIVYYRPHLEKLQAESQQLAAQNSVYDVVFNDVARLVKKIKDLREETKEFRIYEALRKAFGPKGLKKIEIERCVRRLEVNFNKFAHLIYGEPVKFKFVLTESKFDIFIEINKTIMDVRMLSGGETSAFTLLFILSILPLIPSKNRCSLLILDEIEIGADDSFKEMFVEKFLPVLQQVVPHVVVITPQSSQQFYIQNATNYLVTKQNGKAKIEQIL